jgi:hypothetical protein
MSREEYLRIFTKHLRVGEPKREEIITEVRHHLDDAGEAGRMGRPDGLAKAENRIHIGWAWSWWAPLAMAANWLGVYLLLNGLFAELGGTFESIAENNAHATIWFIRESLLFIVPVVSAVYLARVVTRVDRPRKYFVSIFIGLFVASLVTLFTSVVQTSTGLFNEVMGSLLLTIMITIWFMLVFTISLILQLPVAPINKKSSGWGAVYISVYVLALLLGFFLINFIFGDLLQPFDGWLTEMRPAHGSFLLTMNNFFETGGGGGLIQGFYVLAITLILVRKIAGRFRAVK